MTRWLLAASLLQAGLIWLPMPAWTFWLAHFVALEACLLGVLTGGLAAGFGSGWVRWGGLLGAAACLLPALLAVPGYLREEQPFSALAWLGVEKDAGVTATYDVPVGGLLVDRYEGVGQGPRPFVVVIHGGSWRSGDKGDAPHVSRALAAAGITVFDLRYRLAPVHRFPAAVEDVKCLLGEIARGTLGVDPARGALLGRSAGGELALVAAYSDASIGSSCGGAPAPLRAVVSIYGPSDLAWGHDNPLFPDVVDGPAGLEVYLGGTPEAVPEVYRLATPQHWVGERPLPATLLIHGTLERCVRPLHAERLAAVLGEKGQTVKTLYIPAADHGFDVRRGGFGEQLSRGVILDFLKQRL